MGVIHISIIGTLSRYMRDLYRAIASDFGMVDALALHGLRGPWFEGWTGVGCVPLECRREKDAQAGGAQTKASCLSASAFRAFGRRRPEHPRRGSRSADDACPPRRGNLLAMALIL